MLFMKRCQIAQTPFALKEVKIFQYLLLKICLFPERKLQVKFEIVSRENAHSSAKCESTSVLPILPTCIFSFWYVVRICVNSSTIRHNTQITGGIRLQSAQSQ